MNFNAGPGWLMLVDVFAMLLTSKT